METSATSVRASARRPSHASALAVAGSLALVGVAAWSFASGADRADTSANPSPAAVGAFEEGTGVQLVRVAVTGGGGIVDVRYRVIDAEKAAIVHAPGRRPAIVDQQSGEVIGDPFMGMWMHNRFVKPGVVYYQLLVNRNGAIEKDDPVAVRLGGFTLRDVRVR